MDKTLKQCRNECSITPSNNSCFIVLILFILLAIIIGGVIY